MADLLPANATAGERAISEAIARIADVSVVVREMWNPDTCPPELLPWLAWAFSVDSWDANWTDDQKRGVIKNSVQVHQHKGTIGALKGAFSGLGYSVQVQEWFTQVPEGDPYTFRLLVDGLDIGIDADALAKLGQIIETNKNLRSHLSEIEITASSEAVLYLPAVAVMGTEITVEFDGTLEYDGSAKYDGTYRYNGVKVP